MNLTEALRHAGRHLDEHEPKPAKWKAHTQARDDALLAAITDEWQPGREISKKVGCNAQSFAKNVIKLVEKGLMERKKFLDDEVPFRPIWYYRRPQ